MADRPNVLFEDNHLLVVSKPAGWLVQGDHTGDRTLTDWGRNYLKDKFKKPGNVFLHPCHRIDRPVSGLVLFARTSKALERMNRLFRDDEVKKTYLALVRGNPPDQSGKLVHWLIKDGKRNVVKAFSHEKPASKKSILDYELLYVIKDHSLLKINPQTGRPHQIRVQLARIECPIKGDLKYGYPTPAPDKSIFLHSFRLSFVHPVRKEEILIEDLPTWPELERLELNELD